jgi:glycosyltransferase involved in cell wall biosynthesis
MNEDIKNPLFKLLLPMLLHRIRIWDQVSSRRVDHFIANSKNVSKRILKYYGRSSQVIYPPVNFEQYHIAEQIQDYFLIVSRLLPYKRVDMVIEAFNQLKKPLVIIGDGYDRKRLESLAGPHITFLGYQSDETIAQYYSQCQAFIMAGEEDFGITPLEAQASGRPVIAYRKGGSLETVIEGETGLFFNEQKPSSLLNTLEQFSVENFNSDTIRNHALGFSTPRFKQEIDAFIQQKIRGAHHENETC